MLNIEKYISPKFFSLAVCLTTVVFQSTTSNAEEVSFDWLGDEVNTALLELHYASSIQADDFEQDTVAISFVKTFTSHQRWLDDTSLILDFAKTENESELDSSQDTEQTSTYYLVGLEGGGGIAPLIYLSHLDVEDRYEEQLFQLGLGYRREFTEFKASAHVVNFDSEVSTRRDAINQCITDADLSGELRYGISAEFTIALADWVVRVSGSATETSDFDDARSGLADCIETVIDTRNEQLNSRLLASNQIDQTRRNTGSFRNNFATSSSESEFGLEVNREILNADVSVGVTYIDSETLSEPVAYYYTAGQYTFASTYRIGAGLVYEDLNESTQLELSLGLLF